MISLTKRLGPDPPNGVHPHRERVSIRDKLLIKEVQEMEENLPHGCSVEFEDPNKLHEFTLQICPEEGLYKEGVFTFNVQVPLEYNISPPTVSCGTRLWHPNISEQGEICLSILRQNSVDSHGWAPTRRLKDVVWGLSSLFDDLFNVDDPLNAEAADLFLKDQSAYANKVRDWINLYAKS